MKLAIISDMHLGYERFFEDSIKQAEEAVRKGCEKADALILAGDIFDARVPKPEVIVAGLRIFRIPLEKKWEVECEPVARVPVFAIHGTHERRTKGLVNPIQILEAANLMINIHRKTQIIKKGEERIALQGMGGVPEQYAKAALQASEFQPVKNAFNIFIFHQSLKELIPPAGEILSIEDLPKGFDLYINGHIHSAKILMDGKLLIPGSTVITQLRSEEEEKKGFYLFDTQEKKAEFIEISSRPFFYRELEFENAAPQEIRKKAEEEIEKIASAGGVPVIKLVIKGTLAKGFLSSDVVIPTDQFSAIIEIDKKIRAKDVIEQEEIMREFRENRLSVKEMGFEILEKKLKEAKFSLGSGEEIFSILEEEPESAIKKILEKSKVSH